MRRTRKRRNKADQDENIKVKTQSYLNISTDHFSFSGVQIVIE